MPAAQGVAGVVGICLLAGTAGAGPWPREAGTTFVSVTREQDRAGNSHTGYYAEYGLARRRTIGLEIGHTDVGETTAMVWIQKSLDGGEGPDRLSWSTGIGAIRRDGELLPLSQTSLMWGRGISGPWDGGWLTAEARLKVAGKTERVAVQDGLSRAEYAYLTSDIVGKLDLTVGLRPKPSWAVVNQMRLESRKDSDFTARIASSVVFDLTGPARLEGGFILPLTGPGEPAIKIGTWLEF